MIKKIGISVILSFVISFGLLLIVQNYFASEQIIEEPEFYTQEFSPKDSIIFLMGSSHVGQLNSTFIHEKITDKFPQHIVYNLSYKGDLPSERIKTIDKIIQLNPKIILYGISYRDLYINELEKHHILPDPQQFFNELLINELEISNDINPKLITLEIIRKTFSNSDLFPPREIIKLDNSPFFPIYPNQITIANEIELKQFRKDLKWQNLDSLKSILVEKQVKNLNLIIEKLQKNNIKIIIFSTPLHQYYLDEFSPKTKLNFSNILEKIRTIYDIKIYYFSDKYVDENIWANLDHVAYNKKSTIYSEDITDIIITELEK